MSLRRSLLSLLAASALVLSAGMASASDGFHQYSLAYESSRDYTYYGVRLFRQDNNPGGLPADGCNAPFTGHPVYQTQWVIFNTTATDWVEGGTGHQCAGNYRYRFWGYGGAGNWYPQGTQQITETYVRRQHSLWRDLAYRWDYVVDASTIGDNFVTWNRVGIASAGLESYVTGAAVGAHSYDTLRYLRSETWSNWDGRDRSAVNSEMCGRWVSDTEWSAAQNRSC